MICKGPQSINSFSSDKKQTCKVGDKVYQFDTVGKIYESTINKIVYDCGHMAFDERAIGKNIFLTKEEAEKAMKGGADNE